MGLKAASLIAAVAASALIVGFADNADAQGGRSLGDILRNRGAPVAPPVARYVAEQGPAFVLDLSSATPLLKFENSDEVWVLQQRPAGRGDVVYVNDAGETVLRSSRLGGLTMFTDSRPQGIAVSLKGGASPLTVDPIGSYNEFRRRVALAAVRIKGALAHDGSIYAAGSIDSWPLLSDAASVAAEAIESLKSASRSPGVLAKLAKITLREGPAPAASYEQGVLTITVAPNLGVAGRPSSKRIEQALR